MVNLLNKSGDTVLLSVLVVPCFAMALQNTSISVNHLTQLCDLYLTHPLTAEKEFEISHLIGADYYWDIVGDYIVRGMRPSAVESKLGYLLSGPIQPKDTQSTTAYVLMERFWNLESGVCQSITY